MDEETKATVRKIQGVLTRISLGEKFFYNVAQYEGLGLIKPVNKVVTLSNGNTETVFDHHILTVKGRQYMNFLV